MRFLIDENLSPRVAEILHTAGHDAAHAGDLGLAAASDPAVLEAAGSDDREIVSADTGFGALLAHGHRDKPSVVLFRRLHDRRASVRAQLLLDNLDAVTGDLEAGAASPMRPLGRLSGWGVNPGQPRAASTRSATTKPDSTAWCVPHP